MARAFKWVLVFVLPLIAAHWVRAQEVPSSVLTDAGAKVAPTKKKRWTEKVLPAEAKHFWAFEPLLSATPPQPRNSSWCRTPVDQFVIAKLEAAGIEPNAIAGKRQLIRRAFFDLLGLPPSPEDVQAFVDDAAPDAYARLLDRLLASPHYGERWARHWLDLARFAESHGFEHDYDRPTAYHYRDAVIEAFNRDLPYSDFVKWQLAGDEIEPRNNLAVKLTGFLAAGVHSTQITKNEVEKQRYDEMDDEVATLGTAFLGLSIGCARCHDHKYDPIPQRDYYRLLATFTTTVRSEMELPRDPDAYRKAKAAFEVENFGKVAIHIPNAPRPKLVKVLVATEGLPAIRLHTQGDDFLPATYFLKRGDVDNKETVASQSFLQVLMPTADSAAHWQVAPPPGSRTSYRRRALADWITDTDAGAGRLLARVIVNRLWQHHLGRGIVATPSDFGTRGEPPTHPELLDYLAGELIKNGWHLKPIHKLIMTSAVYAQSAASDDFKSKIDPHNKLCWHNPTRRLEAEVIRDALLAVSGTLDRSLYGPGTLDPASKRRSIYFTVKRSKLMPMMVIFDAPEALGGQAERPTTTIAPQALHLLNNPQVRAMADVFARHVAPAPDQPLDKAISLAYCTAFAREPSTQELTDACAFVTTQMATYPGDNRRDLALADFCQVLMCLNEFVYVE